MRRKVRDLERVRQTVSPHLTRLLVRAAVMAGLDRSRLAVVPGMTAVKGEDPGRIPTATMLRTWEVIAAPLGDVGGSGRAMELWRPGALGVWDYLFQAAGTLTDALRDSAKHFSVIADPADEVVVVRDDDGLTVSWNGPYLDHPDGARVAFYVGLNVEHFLIDRPSTSLNEATAALVPDPLNYGWRDYGARVGIWRMMESFDRHGIRPSVLLNSDVADRYPQIIEAGRARNWAWLAHGKNNSILQSGMDPDEEGAFLTEVITTIERATRQRPRGWLGPALTETFQTPALLAELGLSYVLDWTNDDQPYRLNVPGMLSVPYSVELNDLGLFTMKSFTGPDFVQIVKDQLDQLHTEGGRVMTLALHPFVTGQPFRAKYLDRALEHIVNHPGVWMTTSDEIADHCR